MKSLVKLIDTGSFKVRMMWIIMIFVIGITCVLTLVNTWNSGAMLRENALRERSQTLKYGVESLSNFIDACKMDLEVWASQPIIEVFFSRPGLAALSIPGLRTYFPEITEQDPWLEDILLARDGKVLYDDANLLAGFTDAHIPDPLQRLLQAPETDLAVFELQDIIPNAGQTFLFIKRPFGESASGQCIVMVINLQTVHNMLFHDVKIGEHGFLALLATTQTGYVWTPDLDGATPERQEFLETSRQWQRWSDIPASYGSVTIDVCPLFELPVAVAGITARHDMLKPIVSLIRMSGLAGIIVLLAGTAMTFAISSRLTQPLIEFVGNIRHIELDRLEQLHTNSTKAHYTEIAVLHEAFNAMIRKLASSRDEHRQMEDELKEREEKLRTLFQILPVGISVLGADRRILVSNPALERILALPKGGLDVGAYTNRAYLKSDGTVMLPQDFPSMRAFKEQRAVQNVEIGVITENGKPIWTQVNAVPVDFPDWKVVITTADITPQKHAQEKLKAYSEQLEDMVIERTQKLQNAQEQLVRREKLAVLGQMAGSVGHELRRPLATISNAVYYLNMVFEEPDERLTEYLGIIRSETHYAEKIISDLLDFARIKSLEKQHIDLADIVALVLEKHAPSDTIQVTTSIPDDLPAIVADSTHVEQVLSNLVLNAYQAMPQGGTLTISAASGNGNVRVSVTDTGTGIAPEHLDKLFEPLFTTKPKGIGLGLAVCKNLIEANGGSITVESESGQGSAFTLLLPVVAEEKKS